MVASYLVIPKNSLLNKELFPSVYQGISYPSLFTSGEFSGVNVSIINGTLSTQSPTRNGNTASVSFSDGTVYAEPENFNATGYYVDEDGVMWQRGEMSYWFEPKPKLKKRQYNLSEISFQIITEKPENYGGVEVFFRENVTYNKSLWVSEVFANDTWLNYTLYNEPIYNSTNSSQIIRYINYTYNKPFEKDGLTWYYVNRTVTELLEVPITDYDMDTGERFFFRFYFRYDAGSDIFDIQGCFAGVGCILLPAPSITVSTQTNWDGNTTLYNSTDANSTGYLTLAYTPYEPYLGGVNQSSIIGWWKMDNISAVGENNTKVYDWSGNGNNATCSGTTCPTLITGHMINAYDFDNSNDYFSVQDFGNFSKEASFSISLWMRIPSSTPTQADSLVTKVDSSFVGFQTGIRGDVAGDPLEFELRGSSTYSAMRYNPTWTTDWTHIVFTYNGSVSPEGLRAWVNGIEEAGTVQENSLSSQSITNTLPLRLGMLSTSTTPYTGDMDTVIIFQKALNETEIQKIYNETKGTYPKSGYADMNISTPSATSINLTWTEVEPNTKSNVSVTLPNGTTVTSSPVTGITGANFLNFTFNLITNDTTITPYVTTFTVDYDTGAAPTECYGTITGGIYVPSGCTYYIPDGQEVYIT